METKNQCRQRRHVAVKSQPPRQKKYQECRQEVRQDRGEMPPPGVFAENRVIDSQPKQEKRAVVVARFLRIDSFPDMRGEVVGDLVPGMDRGILHNLAPIIVNKFKSKSRTVEGKG